MFVADHQYIVKNLVTTEGRFQYENGRPFSGTTYVEFSNGDKYDVPKADLEDGDFREAKKIQTPDDFVNFAQLLNFNKPFIPKRPENKLAILRYFARNKVNGKIVEIDYTTYGKLQGLNESSHVETAVLTWHITGPTFDSKVLNIFEEGTINKNKREVENLSLRFKGIENYVKDFKFLSDPQYVDMEEPTPNLHIVIPSPA